MAIKQRTNYGAVADGGLDPLWGPDGRHTAAKGYIGAEKDPLGGAFRVQRHTVHDGDILWGGERCEVMSNLIGGAVGKRFQIGFKLLLPTDFSSDNGAWNSLWDMHYPNDGPAQSPLTASIRNSNELWMRVLGGPLNSNGTMGTVGTPGGYKVATLQQGVWNTLGFDILQSTGSDGITDIWLNGTKVSTLRQSNISPGKPNSTYWKQGFYRSPDNSVTATYYFGDTVYWENSTPDEMLTSLFGLTPTPDPVPVPVAKLQKKSETAKTITLEWDAVPGAYGFRYFVDGNPVSVTFAGTTTYATFKKGAKKYEVQVLLPGDLLSYTP